MTSMIVRCYESSLSFSLNFCFDSFKWLRNITAPAISAAPTILASDNNRLVVRTLDWANWNQFCNKSHRDDVGAKISVAVFFSKPSKLWKQLFHLIINCNEKAWGNCWAVASEELNRSGSIFRFFARANNVQVPEVWLGFCANKSSLEMGLF